MEKIPQYVSALLGPGEQIQLYIKQKIYHPKISIDSIALTNERIVLRHPRDLALKKDFTDCSYTDIVSAVLDKGILRSTIKCNLSFGGDPLILGNLSNADAETAYGIIRSNVARYQSPFSAPPTGSTSPSVVVPGTFSPQTAPAANMATSSIGVRCAKCNATSALGSRYCASCGAPLFGHFDSGDINELVPLE
ncbi:MAG TPA: PH domain-containing protein [Candidatus Bathyarchaeia archaeon]|nr:PH domain-containing protein [Candidatus Bathyarchaeia archaeon]